VALRRVGHVRPGFHLSFDLLMAGAHLPAAISPKQRQALPHPQHVGGRTTEAGCWQRPLLEEALSRVVSEDSTQAATCFTPSTNVTPSIMSAINLPLGVGLTLTRHAERRVGKATTLRGSVTLLL
jgi:hypothetical protein